MDYNTNQDELLAAALQYCEWRLPIFPCLPRGKTPLTPHGYGIGGRAAAIALSLSAFEEMACG